MDVTQPLLLVSPVPTSTDGLPSFSPISSRTRGGGVSFITHPSPATPSLREFQFAREDRLVRNGPFTHELEKLTVETIREWVVVNVW